MSAGVNSPTVDGRLLLRILPYLGTVVLAGAVLAVAGGTEQGPALLLAAILVPVLMGLVMARPVLGIILMTGNFLFVYSKWIPIQQPFTPNNALGFLLVLSLLYGLYKERDFWFLKSPAFLLFLTVTILYTVSTINGKSFLPMVPTGRLKWQEQSELEKLITRFAFFLFFIYFVRTKRQILSVMAFILFMLYAAVPASFIMVLKGEGWGGYRARAGWLIHSAGNPNRLAFLCLFSVGIIWHYVSARPRAGVRWVAIPALVSLVLGVLATGSRSGFLNLLIMGMVLISQSPGARVKRALIAVVVLIATALLAGQVVPERAMMRATTAFIDPASDAGYRSTTKRLGTVVWGARIVAQHPLLGVGIGNFLVHHQALDPGGYAGAAHNSYLQALTEGGILTFVAYMALFSWCMQVLVRLERGYAAGLHRQINLVWLIRALRANWLLLLSFSLFADVWLHILFYAMVGLTVSMKRLHGYREQLLFHAVPVTPAVGPMVTGYPGERRW